MLCSKCGNHVAENAKFCGKCGNKMEKPVAQQPPAHRKVEAIWPEWQVDAKPIGKGSFGAVYRAVRKDHNMESVAAIKVISIPQDSSEVETLRSEGMDETEAKTYLNDIVNDFVGEIQLMESMKGVQNIVSVEDYKVVERAGEIGWNIYIRMELLTPFNTYLTDRELTENEVIRLGCDICTALEICSKRNVIHRDIKPENIFINDFGHFKLGDFGIARKLENMTGGLSQKGTFNYLAPEVATSRDYDARVDIYSLGIVLYRLLNGNKLPFLDNEQYKNPNARRAAVERRLRGEKLPTPCKASPAMASVILRACAFDPNERFSSASEMKKALLSVANGTYQIPEQATVPIIPPMGATMPQYRPIPAPQPAAPMYNAQNPAAVVQPAKKVKPKKNKLPLIIAAVLAVVILAGAGIFVVPKLLGGKEATKSGQATASFATEPIEKHSEMVDETKSEAEKIGAILDEAESYAAKGDFEAALAEVNVGLKSYPSDEGLKTKAGEYTAALNAALIEEAILSAEEFAKQKDFLNAYKTIEHAIASIGEAAELTAKATEYEKECVEDISYRMDALIAEEEIADAKNLIQEAHEILPNNITITQLWEELQLYREVSVRSLTPINETGSWNNTDVKLQNALGEEFSDASNFFIPYQGSYGEYYIEGKYSVVTGKLTSYCNMEEERISNLQIWADDTIIYNSPPVTQKTKQFSFVVPLPQNTQNIKFVCAANGYSNSEILLTDLILWNDPYYYEKHPSNGSVAVRSLTPINSSGSWNTIPLLMENALGESFADAQSFFIPYQDSYGEYYIDSKYSRVTGSVTAYCYMEKGRECTLQIIADEEVVYTSPTIMQSTTQIPFAVTLPEGTRFVKFVCKANGYSNSEIFITDLFFWE